LYTGLKNFHDQILKINLNKLHQLCKNK